MFPLEYSRLPWSVEILDEDASSEISRCRDGCYLRRPGDFPCSVEVLEGDVSSEILQCSRDGCSLWRAGDFPWGLETFPRALKFLMEIFLLIVSQIKIRNADDLFALIFFCGKAQLYKWRNRALSCLNYEEEVGFHNDDESKYFLYFFFFVRSRWEQTWYWGGQWAGERTQITWDPWGRRQKY